MDLPWWAWVLIVLGIVIFLFARAGKTWRASIREELLAYFARSAPELEMEVQGERQIAVRRSGGEEGTLYLHNLLRDLALLKGDDPAEREVFYERLLDTYREEISALELDPERDRTRILPRLVTDRIHAEMLRQAPIEIPSADFGVPGLVAVFVLDSEHSVRYLDVESLPELGLTVEQALELAKDNLRESLPANLVQGTVRDGDINVVKSMDTYDAARLLLLPEQLGEGEAVVALIPDRDTLALAQVPGDGDWKSLRKLARNAAGEPLWTRPILVRPDGFTAVE